MNHKKIVEFEGHDYAGKSELLKHYRNCNDSLYYLHFPLNVSLPKLAKYNLPFELMVELYTQDRNTAVLNNNNYTYLCDRYLASTYIYQAQMEANKIKYVSKIHKEAGLLNPDLLFLCFCSDDEIRNRIQQREATSIYDKYENIIQNKRLYEKFANIVSYLSPYKETNVIVLDTGLPVEYNMKIVNREIEQLQKIGGIL